MGALNENCPIGQREKFSEVDIRKINTLYQFNGYPQITSGFTTTPMPCENKQSDSSCKHWTSLGYCTQTYQSYMAENCRKECGHCSSATTTATTSTTTTTTTTTPTTTTTTTTTTNAGNCQNN